MGLGTFGKHVVLLKSCMKLSLLVVLTTEPFVTKSRGAEMNPGPLPLQGG